jgi:hypothetical protein|uniref:Uncharacterized protein n=1 Tax=viral metagenome TaxID=1070528 RepID=A0A6C0BGI4_9ZZZZ
MIHKSFYFYLVQIDMPKHQSRRAPCSRSTRKSRTRRTRKHRTRRHRGGRGAFTTGASQELAQF